MASNGASNNERLLAAARENNADLLEEVLKASRYDKGFDINYKDGLGNTALHYATCYGSVDVLENILVQEDCDVDPINNIEKATPLHLALTALPLGEERSYIVENLLDAGASTGIRDKSGRTAADLIKQKQREDPELYELLLKSQIEKSIKTSDIANDDIDDDEDGLEPGSGSGCD